MTRTRTYGRKRPIPLPRRVKLGDVLELEAFVGWLTTEVRKPTDAERDALRVTRAYKLVTQRKGRVVRTLLTRPDVDGGTGWFAEVPGWRKKRAGSLE